MGMIIPVVAIVSSTILKVAKIRAEQDLALSSSRMTEEDAFLSLAHQEEVSTLTQRVDRIEGKLDRIADSLDKLAARPATPLRPTLDPIAREPEKQTEL